MDRGDFPLQKNCSRKKPDEFAAWALVALPHMNGAALPMSSEYLQKVSEHLWKCGFRWNPRYQKIKWRAPSVGDAHWLTNPGRWVPIDEPDPEEQGPTMVDVLSAMKQADEKGFFDALDKVKGL